MNLEIINSTIDSLIQKEIESIKTHRASGGKTVAVFNGLFPQHILDGCGIRSFRITKGADTVTESTGEQLVRPDSCPLCKSIIGGIK